MSMRKKTGFQVNKQTIIVSSAVAAIIVIALGFKFLGAEDSAKLYNDSPVIAKVNGQPVYQLEADNIVKSIVPPSEGKQLLFTDLDEKSKAMVVREIAAQRAMADEAKDKGLKESDEIKRKVFEYKNKLIRDELLSKFANTEINQEKLQAKYGEIEKAVKGKPQLKVSHILVGSESEATNALNLLKKESFAKVAKEVSQDGATKDRGGDLGYLLIGTMDPDFEKAALTLKQGETSGPVKSKFGWHIIKLDDKRIATVPAFEALQGRIAQDIYNESLKKYADDLLADVKIELVASEEKKEDAKTDNAKQDVKPVETEETKEEPKE